MNKASRIVAAGLAASMLSGGLLLPLAARSESVRQSEVRELRAAGRILAMEDILARVRSAQPGQVVEIELERESGRYVYEVKLIDETDRIRVLELDAATGEIVRRHRK